jgi:hypothetical protein
MAWRGARRACAELTQSSDRRAAAGNGPEHAHTAAVARLLLPALACFRASETREVAAQVGDQGTLRLLDDGASNSSGGLHGDL